MSNPQTLSNRQLPFAVVTKPTGAACNLDCKYCFFLSKELLYNARQQTMSEATLELYIQRFLQAQPDGNVTMLWQGGEPTLRGLDFYKLALKLCDKYRRPDQVVKHALQTNGTLINAEWARFLFDNDFLVGISLDGPEEYHDTYRVNRAGRPTQKMVLKGWEHLQNYGVKCNILCTIHHANQDHGQEVYRYFRDSLGADFIQFIPIVERVNDKDLAQAEAGWRSRKDRNLSNETVGLLYRQQGQTVTSRSVEPERYGRFLLEVFNEWLRHDVGKVFVQDFDAALAAMFGQISNCVHAPICGNNFALEFNADVYACDHWVEPDWKLGNLRDKDFFDLANTERAKEFAKKKSQLSQKCLHCRYLRLCYGGCPKDRFVTSDNKQPSPPEAVKSATGGRNPFPLEDSRPLDPPQNYLCPGYHYFYRNIFPTLQQMTALVASGKPAADIMERIID